MKLTRTLWLLPASVVCLLLASCSSESKTSRVLASHLVLEGPSTQDGLYFTINLTPGKDYIVELRGRCQIDDPILRFDLDEPDAAGPTFYPVPASGLTVRVRTAGALRLLLFGTVPYRYTVDSLSVRPAVTPEDFAVPIAYDGEGPVWRRILAFVTSPFTGREAQMAARSADANGMPGTAKAPPRVDKGFNRYAGSPPLLFTSWEFVCLFLPIVLLVQRLLKFGRWAVAFLVVASFFWYSVWDWRFGPLILLSITVNWWGGMTLERRRQRALFVALLLFNLLPLFYFKYIKFAFFAVGLKAGDWITPALLPAVLPLGISFYTFQKIAYLTDIYRGQKAERGWLNFAFFVLFFPQLVAGPITHHSLILPQLRTQPTDRKTMFLMGCVYFVIGFVKKRFIADFLAAFVDVHFHQGNVRFADQAILATVGYTLQLYFDFSGYSDMALGLGAMFGFRLPWNFNSPYKALSFREFWQRWHMTLSAFLRDYVYIPLGGSRVADWRRYLNLFLTMLIGGIWHGAGWAFVAWGAGHGLLLCAHHALGEERWGRVPAVLRSCVVVACVALLWIPFRAESLPLTGEILHAFASWRLITLSPEALYCMAGLGMVLFAPNSHTIAEYCIERFKFTVHTVWELGGRVGWYACFSILCAAMIVSWFYEDAPDVWLRSNLRLATIQDYVDIAVGDLRTNIDRCGTLQGASRKWVIAGPSYATSLGLFTWRDSRGPVTVGSAGIGGQGIESWIRIPGILLRDPSVRRIYIACEPIGVSPPNPLAFPFPGEGGDVLGELGIESSPRPLGSLGPARLGVAGAAWDIATLKLKSGKYFQLQTMVLAVGNALRSRNPVFLPQPLSKGDLTGLAADIGSLWLQARASPRPPANMANGADAQFFWNRRGIIEGLADGGKTDRVLGKLIDEARARGVEIILYGSPTLEHNPTIYPAGFFDRYRSAIEGLARRHKVRYVDLTGLFPEDDSAMYDFCHARVESRPYILKTLLLKTEDDDAP
jgi:D-alanyl-lipoteichoic acid acyltransferase DltB (MBOAT superfamily)